MSNRLELLNNPEEALRVALDGRMASVWTALPGIITKVNFDAMTCEVQPAIQGIITNPDGTTKNVNLPLLVDVPIVFPSAGGFILTFPMKADDEVLVIIASRCIDTWWQSGGIGLPAEARMHDLSDGFAIPGPRSQPKKVSNISAENVQLRNDEGDTYIEITPGGKVKIEATTEVELKAPNIKIEGETSINGETSITGNLNVSGNVSASGSVEGSTVQTSGGIGLASHKHGGVQPGSGSTGGATP